LHGGELPNDLLELRDVLGWKEIAESEKRWYELLVFYLTLRSGVLVSEVRVAWVEEALSALRAMRFLRKPSGKVKITGVN
jgi:hypothetical protein